MLVHQVIYLTWLGFVHASIPSQDDHAQHSPGRSLAHNGIDSYGSGLPPCSQSPSTSEEFCVYTSTWFAGGRGISILANSTQTKALLQLPPFADPTVLSSLGVNKVSDPPFNTVQLEDRGVGLIANRTIRRGEWLMSFTPAFMVAKKAVASLNREDRLLLQRLALEQLPLPLQNVAFALYGQKSGASDDHIENHIEDVLNTNSFELPVEVKPEGENETYEVEYKVLFPEIAVSEVLLARNAAARFILPESTWLPRLTSIPAL